MLSDKLYCMVIKVEKEIYKTANSAAEYYQLLPTINYLLKFDFKHWRRKSKNDLQKDEYALLKKQQVSKENSEKETNTIQM